MKRSIACALLLAAAGCKKHEPEREPPPPAAAPTKKTVAAAEPDGVVLVSPGAEPRRVLRYHLAKGAKAPMEMVADVDMNGSKLPSTDLETTIGADDVLPDGSAKVRMTIAKARARDRSGAALKAAQMAPMMSALENIAITMTLAPDGAVTGSAIEHAELLAPSVAAQIAGFGKSLEEVSIRMPREPVGVGARWTTRARADQGGIQMQVASEIELVALDGDRATYRAKTTTTAATQRVGDADISATSGRAESSGTVDLSTMVVTSVGTLDFTTTATIAGQATTTAFAMKTRVGPSVPDDDQGEHKAP